MGHVDLALTSLYATGLLFSIIELGLSAYIVDVATDYSYFGVNGRYSFAPLLFNLDYPGDRIPCHFPNPFAKRRKFNSGGTP